MIYFDSSVRHSDCAFDDPHATWNQRTWYKEETSYVKRFPFPSRFKMVAHFLDLFRSYGRRGLLFTELLVINSRDKLS